MSAQEAGDWQAANQRYLVAALAGVRTALERHLARRAGKPDRGAEGADTDLRAAAEAMPSPPALEALCAFFALSPFERDLLLLCAGIELDGSFAALCASAHGGPARPHPTFGLALATLAEPHWSALSPGRPLRYWHLVDFGSGEGLAQRPLRIDERVLHYLAGVDHLDERLVGYVERVTADDELVPSQRAVAERMAAIWTQGAGKGPLPVVQLCAADEGAPRPIAAAGCARLGLDLYVMPAQVLPHDPRELDLLVRLWEREAVLSGSALLLESREQDPADPARDGALARFVERVSSALVLAGRERRSCPHRPVVVLDVGRPTPGEQRQLWQRGLGRSTRSVAGTVDRLVTQFSLGPAAIEAVCGQARSQARPGRGGKTPAAALLAAALWDTARVQARPRLENLARRIEPVATWNDLVLPDAQKEILRQVAVHARRRKVVYEEWGFASRGARGLGISALFSGSNGTGKTMAAEVLANELQLDLFRIDLSQVVSKYIGETEKNLRQVFDAAELGGVILFFDEADALFGKRSEVKDSHDRYANIEISYLLQRMEDYVGLAILVTNMRSALDSAFLRRIRFVVQFPFPDAAARAEIWCRIFPPATPTEGLDPVKLAQLNIAGGNIRNIALHAAFLAAEAGEPVRMTHLARAARIEYGKLEKPLTEAEIRGWG